MRRPVIPTHKMEVEPVLVGTHDSCVESNRPPERLGDTRASRFVPETLESREHMPVKNQIQSLFTHSVSIPYVQHSRTSKYCLTIGLAPAALGPEFLCSNVDTNTQLRRKRPPAHQSRGFLASGPRCCRLTCLRCRTRFPQRFEQ